MSHIHMGLCSYAFASSPFFFFPGFCSSVLFVSSSQTLVRSRIKLYHIWRSSNTPGLYIIYISYLMSWVRTDVVIFYNLIIFIVYLLCIVALVYFVSVCFILVTWLDHAWFSFSTSGASGHFYPGHLTWVLAQSLVNLRLGNCRLLMKGILLCTICLQLNKNAATWLVFNFLKFFHITPLHRFLHWLPVAVSFRF